MSAGTTILAWVIGIAIMIAATWLALKINKIIFGRIRKRNNSLHYMYMEKFIAAGIIVCMIVLVIGVFSGLDNIWKSILGSTAVISAVVGIAAQDVLKNVLAGAMLSIHKPFDLGDRIILEDDTAGIVKKMNTRQVELVGLDGVRIIIPNSVIVAMKLRNHNFTSKIRSIQFKFYIGYDSDMDKAKRVITEAIAESDHTLPRSAVDNKGENVYGKIYFVEFASSALVLTTTVYYENIYTSEVIMDEINTRVREALMQNGIEIPYPYVNVVDSREGGRDEVDTAKNVPYSYKKEKK